MIEQLIIALGVDLTNVNHLIALLAVASIGAAWVQAALLVCRLERLSRLEAKEMRNG